MKKSLLTLLIMFLAVSVGYGQMADVKEAVTKKERQMYEALKAGDMKTFEANLAENFVSVSQSGIVNRAQELKNMQNLTINSYELMNIQVMQPAEGIAVLVYTLKGSGSYMGEKFDGEYYCTSIWKNTNGQWKGLVHTEAKADDEMGNMDDDMDDDDY